MDFLFDIPVLGILFQLIDFIVKILTNTGPIILALATPLALGAMCGLLNERSGVVNIGIEGMMLMSAFSAWYVASIVGQLVESSPGVFFGVTTPIVAGLIAALDLTALEDDRQYFPPYDAVPVVHAATLLRHPEIGAALSRLAGRVSAAEMRRMNFAVDAERQDPAVVVRAFLDALDSETQRL